MIPGQRLRAGEHYLVFDEPEEIPDLVSDWCRPSRADDLAAIAERGRRKPTTRWHACAGSSPAWQR